MRISRKNARIIRAGIKSGQKDVRLNQAGMLPWLTQHSTPLEHRAYTRVIHKEIERLADLAIHHAAEFEAAINKMKRAD